MRITLLSTANQDKACVATSDAVAARREELNPHFRIEEDLWSWKGRLYIHNDIDPKNMILHDNDDSKLAGNFRIYKTVDRLKHNY